jgi:hypothetical protein
MPQQQQQQQQPYMPGAQQQQQQQQYGQYGPTSGHTQFQMPFPQGPSSQVRFRQGTPIRPPAPKRSA